MKDNGLEATPLSPSGFNAEDIANASPVSSNPLPIDGEYSSANSSKVVFKPS